LAETLAFDAILSAQNFLSGINQMIQGMTRAESAAKSSGSSISAGLAQGLGQKGDFNAVGRDIGNTVTQSIGSQFGMAGQIAGDLAGALGPVGIAAGVAGAALIGAGVASVNLARAWETSMAGVSKTTGLTGTDLAKLSAELQTMSTTMPIAASELANIAGVAGSLGVAKENIAGFTEVAAMMGVGFAMPADQAATAAAKILNAFNKPIDSSNMMALGNVVNMIGDSMAATEPEMLDFINRASYLGTTMGQSIPQIAALGGVLISAGLSSETASTGIKSLLNMGLSEKTEGKGAFAWAELMGVSVDQLKSKIGTDFNSTLAETADKIAQIEDPVKRFEMAVALAGTEGAPALLKLAGSADTLKQKMADANSEWTNGTSLQKTFEAQSATLNSQWQIFTNTLGTAGTSLGTVMLPALTDTVKILTEGTKAAIEFGGAISSAISGFAAGDKEVSGAESSWIDKLLGYDINDYKRGGKYGSTQAEADQAAYAASQAATSYTDEWGNVFEGEAMKGKLIDPMAEVLASEEAKAALEKTAEEDAKTWLESFGGAMEAGMTQTAEGVWESWDAITSEKMSKDFSYTPIKGGKTYQAQGGDYSSATETMGMATINDVALTSSYFTMSGGSDTMFRLKNENGDIIASGTASSLGISDPGSQAGQQAAIRALMDASWNTGQVESLMLQGRTGEADKLKLSMVQSVEYDYTGIVEPLKSELIASGEDIGASASEETTNAFQAMLDAAKEPSVEKLQEFINSVGENIRLGNVLEADGLDDIRLYKEHIYSGITDMGPYLKELMGSLGEESTSAFSDKFFSDTEKESLMGMGTWLEYLKTKSPEEFAKAGGDSWLAFFKAMEAGASSGEMDKLFGDLALGARDSFEKNLVGGLKIELPNLLAFIEDPKKALVGIENIPLYIKNAILPALATSMGQAKTLIDNGGIPDAIKAQYIDPLDKVAQYLPLWLQTLLSELDKGNIGVKGFLDDFDLMSSSLSKQQDQLKMTSVGYDNAKDSVDGFCEAMSGLGVAQENSDELFKGSWLLAQGGEKYAAWAKTNTEAIAATQRATQGAGGVSLGQDYTGQEAGIPTRLDTAQAVSDLVLLKSKITEEVVMPVSIDAIAAFETIRLIDLAASAPITKIVNVVEVGSGGGGIPYAAFCK
jgi:TP901 family phage tail tape measure protein